MVLLVRTLATVMDVAAMLAMALALELMGRWVERWRVGPAPLLQPWHDIVRLVRKQRVRPGFASPFYAAWPVIALSASGAALTIVPGFAFGLLTARLATIPVILALLAVAALARLAALLESGDGARGVAAARAARRWWSTVAVWLAGLGALAIWAGSDRIALIGGALALRPGHDGLGVLVGLGLVLSMSGWILPKPRDYGGPERALFQIEAMLRLAVLVALVVDVVAPRGMADARLVASWPLGLLAWLVAMALLGGVFVLVAARPGSIWFGAGCVGAGVVLVAARQVDFNLALMLAGGIVGLVGLGWLMQGGVAARAASLVQIGVALIGLGGGGVVGPLLILVTIGLARLGLALAPGRRWMMVAGLVALGGLPPFGGFSGDFVVVRAVGPVLGGGILAGLLGMAILLIGRLPDGAVTAKIGVREVAAGVCFGGALALGLVPFLAWNWPA